MKLASLNFFCKAEVIASSHCLLKCEQDLRAKDQEILQASVQSNIETQKKIWAFLERFENKFDN